MASGIKTYPFDEIESRWQSYWEEHKSFRAADPGEAGSEKPKYYVLDMFPYPSGSGLHVGHLEGYTATDIIARYKRMRGFNVLHPIGWDAFGLPAEQHALETGTHPRETTAKNVANFIRQIKSMGFSYDWDREVNTTDVHYYKWTQWIFMQLYKKGLAYESEVPVNWCPELGTVLANEEVIDGKSERGDHPVIRKPMRQWVLKITAYADRLLEDLDDLDWPESIKEQQRNWIGKSSGAEVDFKVAEPCHSERSEESQARDPSASPQDDKYVIRVFTTRPDTLFGATYMVLAPEHALVSKITTEKKKRDVEAYIEAASRKSDLERTDLAKEKTGVFTGAYAVNPVNQVMTPIWIADYVLATYGTGAIMAVPAHDARDFEFAKKFDLPIKQVILGTVPEGTGLSVPKSKPVPSGTVPTKAFTGVGTCVNSSSVDETFSINGLKSDEAKGKITKWLEEKGLGEKSVQYKLRDWLFSRQRYWGEPFPIIYVEGKPQILDESDLPIELPETNSYKPTGTGESPLAAIKEWVEVKDPKTGKPARRETNTMPQWAGSCWYYLRYLDPLNDKLPVDSEKEKYWMSVDLYVGGAEHAVLHLLYARFWHKVLYDLGVVSTKEPFFKLVNQGMILGEDNQKMSKSRGNVLSPDNLIKRYGADSVRLYEMFMGPLELTKPWSMQGVEGVYRFLGRVWRLLIDTEGNLQKNITEREPLGSELKSLHKAIKKTTEDMEGLKLNTAISALMVFVNEANKEKDHAKSILERFVLLLAPFAPHIAEELWTKLGHSESLIRESWPEFDLKYLVEDEVEMAIMVKGKVRAKIKVAKDTDEGVVKDLALKDERLGQWLQGQEIKKVIVVPNRMVNIVV